MKRRGASWLSPVTGNRSEARSWWPDGIGWKRVHTTTRSLFPLHGRLESVRRRPGQLGRRDFSEWVWQKTITMYLAPIFLMLSILLVGDSKLAASFVFVYALLLLLTRRS